MSCDCNNCKCDQQKAIIKALTNALLDGIHIMERVIITMPEDPSDALDIKLLQDIIDWAIGHQKLIIGAKND
jgi:hypothetical protein